MPKKKKAAKETPDTFKEAGNKAFLAREFEEAINQYTKAIEMSGDQPSHVYFANRANAQLELGRFEECIIDCDKSIEIDPAYIKAYFRKCKALLN